MNTESMQLKDHVALLFAWMEERATEVSQERASSTIKSHRSTAEQCLDAEPAARDDGTD